VEPRPYSSVWTDVRHHLRRCQLSAQRDRSLAVTRTPRSSWIDEGLRALGAGGPDAVRIELLAQALGVTRGGFYWQFEDRRALLEEMLDTWERRSVDEVIERVESEGGDARAKLRRLSALAASGDEPLRTDLAVRDWSRREQPVAERLRRVDNRRMEYLRSLFAAFCPDEDDVEARCMVFYSLWIGSHFIAADHGARSRADVLRLALTRLLA
jgi:AcrR family transcriptional regulator